MRLRLVFALTLLTACSSSGPVADEDNPFRPSSFDGRGSEIDIYVNNINFADATLMALHEGGRTRLGRVGGKSEGRFELAWPGVRDLHIQIDLLAGDQYTTPPISVSPGDRVGLVVESVLSRSMLTR